MADYLDSRGLVHFRMGNYKAAIADYDKALELEPDAAYSLFVRGLAHKKLGDAAAGDKDIAAAKAIDADVVGYFRRRGVTP